MLPPHLLSVDKIIEINKTDRIFLYLIPKSTICRLIYVESH